MKDNKKTIQLLLIFTVIFSIMGGSLAYWNWNTTEGQKTNVVFTVTQDFSCAADGGGNITSNDVSLAPTTCTDTSRAIKRKVTVTPTLNRETMTLSMDLWLTINDLGKGLKKSNNFRYVLTTSDSSCEEGTIMASGNFKGRKVGNKVNLLTNELYTETPTEPEEYYLYIWLDAEETSSSTMNQTFSLSLGGQCEEVETLKGEAYALLLEEGIVTDDWVEEVQSYTLTFIRSETPITAGSEYDGKVVAEVYSGIETTTTVPWNFNDFYVTNIEFKDTIRPISTTDWFSREYSGDERGIDLSKLDTSQVTDMSGMFSGSDEAEAHYNGELKGLENFDTSKVTNMSSLFSYNYDLSLDLSNWNVSNVINMSYMFFGGGLMADLSNWDTSQVIDMEMMFFRGSRRTLSSISTWNVSNVTNMSNIFEEASADMDLSNWDVSSVTNMSGMFWNASVDVDLSNWDVSSVTDMSYMFYSPSINIDMDLSNWDVSNVTNMSWMFGWPTITNIGDISSWDVSNVTSMSSMFYSAKLNTTLDLSNWNVVKVGYYKNFGAISSSSTGTLTMPVWRNAYLQIYSTTDKSLRIYNDLNVPSVGDVYDGRTVTNVYNMSAGTGSFSCGTTITPTSIVVEDNITPTSLSSWFSGCTKVNYVDVTKMDVSNTSSLYRAFYNVGSDSSVTNFTIVGLDKWDTSNVIGMNQTFYNMGLNANYTLDLSRWDVSKVTNHWNFDYGVTDKIIDPLWNQ